MKGSGVRDDRQIHILDAEGQPVVEPDLFTWANWFEDNKNRVVKQQRVYGCRVSTVFLALDHNFLLEGPPILWETMVFGGPLDQEMERYSTREAAIAGHEAMCVRVREAMFSASAWWKYLREGRWQWPRIRVRRFLKRWRRGSV